MTKREQIAWAAGLIEGEGTIALKTGTSLPVVAVENTDLDVLERLQSIFRGTLCMPVKRQAHWKQSWVWTLNGKAAKECLEAIRPLLCKRRQQKADSVLRAIAAREKQLAQQEKEKELQRKEARRLIDSGLTLRQAAEKLLVSHETVRRWCKP